MMYFTKLTETYTHLCRDVTITLPVSHKTIYVHDSN